MTHFTEGAAEPVPLRRSGPLGRWGWALFDWANQPFFTVVTTFIFAPYFATRVIGDPVQGQAAWAHLMAVSGVVIAVLSPFLGAIADAAGRRKPFLLVFQALTCAGCALLWLALPGRADLMSYVMAGIVLATIGAEFSIVFNNSLLPGLVPASRIGRWSGLGWGIGYVGGIIALFAVLIVTQPELIGVHPPAGKALFGLDRATFEAERLTGPVSSLWLLLFVLPMFLFTPDTPASGLSRLDAARAGTARLWQTVKALPRYRNPATYLVAYMFYNDGLQAIIALGGIYAAGTFGWSTTELGIFGILVTIVAAMAAFIGGWLDDHIGSRRTIQIAIVLATLSAIGIASVTATGALFVLDFAPKAPGAGLFGSPPELVFLGLTFLMGTAMGPMQAASRTMMGRLAPAHMIGEFYGLFALSGRATVWMAPAVSGAATLLFDSQRAGVIAIVPFFVAGFVLLWRVREVRG
jgi:UMF1 family MFS transporter